MQEVSQTDFASMYMCIILQIDLKDNFRKTDNEFEPPSRP